MRLSPLGGDAGTHIHALSKKGDAVCACHSFSISQTHKTSEKHQRGPRQEFFNKLCRGAWKSLPEGPCCFYWVYVSAGAAVKYYEVYSAWDTQILPRGSSGTGQFQDWTGGFAAGISKHSNQSTITCYTTFIFVDKCFDTDAHISKYCPFTLSVQLSGESCYR